MEEFKFLILWAEEVPQRVEELKKVLRLNQNYLEARDHAMLAVGKDNRLRFWTNANVSHAGALFSANLGSIELDHPAGKPLHLPSPHVQQSCSFILSPDWQTLLVWTEADLAHLCNTLHDPVGMFIFSKCLQHGRAARVR